MQTIYIDVLLFFNFCVNYFLLRGTAFLTHTPCRIPRCLLSALLGSFSALVILLPPLPLAVNLLIRLGTAAGMNGVLCFGLSRRTMLRQTIWFFCCSMLFAGFLMFLQQSTNSRRIFLGNQCFTCSFLPVCIFCTLLAYGVLGRVLACCPDAMPTHRCSLSGLYSHRLRNSDTNGVSRHRKQLG